MTDLPYPYSVTFEDRDEYLYVRVVAPVITKEMCFAYYREIGAECRARNARRIMLERDVTGVLSMLDAMEVSSFILNELQGIKVAFVNPYLSNEQSLQFQVTFGVNRGALHEVFKTTADAEAWLLGQKPTFLPAPQD